ncbi:hypothetical protein D0Z70_22530 [Sphingobium terrigena]|uniref:Uncharacterized protein n=1 Tax=Sphingobium terrigena TaxID=2304063 RepID=A0A418YLE6_9SPHN|nr:hypothetical protein [Sphingobium terrigena]RJG51808.1 hypothetical protein D0Z70_22530 [Sphingobium terrigena]
MLIYRQNYAALIYIPRPKPRQRKPILSINSQPVHARSRRRQRTNAPIGTTKPAIDLLPRIKHLAFIYDLNESQIGREALGDPNLVSDIRAGRRLRDQTRARLVSYLDRVERGEG